MDSKRIQSQIRQGTVLYALLGSPIRHVSRLIGDQISLVGKCYVHGCMDGEALLFLKTGQAETDEILNYLSQCSDLM